LRLLSLLRPLLRLRLLRPLLRLSLLRSLRLLLLRSFGLLRALLWLRLWVLLLFVLRVRRGNRPEKQH